MAAPTYSLSITGVPGHNPFQPTKQVTLPDNVGISSGSEQNTMQTGAQFLCKMPDGSQAWHVFDESRCIPGVLRVLRRV
jgi:hypothetical protein